MSAFLGVHQGNVVHVLADAAHYAPNGVATAFADKLAIVPGTDAVFVARGPVAAIPSFRRACADAQLLDFDDLLDRHDDVFSAFDRSMAKGGAAPNEILLAGDAPRRGGPLLLYRVNHKHHSGFEPRHLYSMGVLTSGSVADLPDPALFTPTDGVASFERLRSRPMPPLGGGLAIVSLGGWITHAEVRAGQTPIIRRIHTWEDDRVGQPLAT